MTEHQLQRTERAFAWADLAVGGLLLALIYAVVTVARQWGGQLQPVAAIHLEGRYLPLYALFSLTRGVIAYAIHGDVRVEYAALVGLPAAASVAGATALQQRVPGRTLELLFAAFLFGIAVWLFVK